MRTEQTQRVAKEEVFPFVWENRNYLSKNEFATSHVNRMKTVIDENGTLTPYDISKLTDYYEIVMGKKYNTGVAKPRHDFRKRLRF